MTLARGLLRRSAETESFSAIALLRMLSQKETVPLEYTLRPDGDAVDLLWALCATDRAHTAQFLALSARGGVAGSVAVACSAAGCRRGVGGGRTRVCHVGVWERRITLRSVATRRSVERTVCPTVVNNLWDTSHRGERKDECEKA